MPRARVSHDIELEYEDTGPSGAPPVLLIMGVGAQLIHWPDGFVELLARRGLRVVRFDNRDAGLSTKLDHRGVPRIKWMLVRALMGLSVSGAPYRLEDMAGDAAGLLDALGLPHAHVVGISMGGMIAQTMAIARPDRVLSLTSLMSTPGGRYVGQYGAIRALVGPPPRTRADAIECGVRLARAISGAGYPLDEARLRELAARSWDRAHSPAGFARQMAAILSAPARSAALARVTAPTLVIHGEHDPLVPVEAGRATAAAIPGSRLVVLPGLGHSLPEGAWPLLTDEIAGHVLSVHERQARAA